MLGKNLHNSNNVSNVKLIQKVSSIGKPKDQRNTLLGLGLGKIGDTSILKNTPSVKGMIIKVNHLISHDNYSE